MSEDEAFEKMQDLKSIFEQLQDSGFYTTEEILNELTGL